MKKIYSIFLILLLLLTLSACSTQMDSYNQKGTYSEVEIDLSNPDNLQTFTSESDYQEFFSSIPSSQNYYDGFGRGGIMMETMAIDSAMPMVKSNEFLDDGHSNDFSETNNQVQGIDEADLIKTDGEFIYTITDNTIFVIKAYPGNESEIISQVSLDNVYPSDLILTKDSLIVLGSIDKYKFQDELGVIPENEMSFAYVYDISNKAKLTLEKEFLLEGSYDTARLNGDAYIVTRVRPEIRTVYPLPMIVDDGVISTLKPTDMFYLPYSYDYPEIAIVNKLDLENYNLDSIAVTVDHLQTVYMSEDNIYLIGHESISEYKLEQDLLNDLIKPLLSEKDSTLIQKIKDTDNDVLSQYEKEQKIQSVYSKRLYALSSDEQSSLEDEAENLLAKKLDQLDYLDNVLIHKIDANSLEVVASNKVPGQVVNQFSLDEYNDHLRIATTIPQRWSKLVESQKEEKNNIYILDNSLEITGSLTDIANDERIYSTRFIGEKLYMVTFKQVDPFFVVDLSDVTNPKSLGELKIPGFSRYLHPYDENHIIGIGQDTNELGRTKGLKISLFDVEDVANPQEVAKFVTDKKYASSTALYEHKAFLFSKEKNLLVIPAYSYEWEDGKQTGYSGAFVFNVSIKDIKLRGLIDHAKDSNDIWNSQVERSLYINDLLYTKSRNLLRINSLDTLVGVKDLVLKPTKSGDIPIF